ncbi:MAG: hypothetical protein J0H73_14405 [Salana multivorans]|uniref:sensor histidine kinase n=1 Tax=Salana multivorans TaxID=120377 RepID=UPI001ACEA255|nr:histidine kinase [Salana multivorans]MBN8883493.1 hypothetical protein [Salana multivorans]
MTMNQPGPGLVAVPSGARDVIPPSPARRVLSVAGTVAAVVLVGFLGLSFAVVPAPPTDGDLPPLLLWHMTGAAAAVGAAVAMVWRSSRPVPVLLATAAATLVLPIGPLAPVVALPWVLARGSRRTIAWAIPLTGVAVAVALGYDAVRPGDSALLALNDEAGAPVTPSAVAYAVIGVLLLGGAVLAGLWRRSLAAVGVAQDVAQEAVQHSVELRRELTRQEEREHIAREMHDTVAHHLSLLSLHAAALEVTSQDPLVPDAARSMRSSAHQALEEMRGLITSLRDSADGGYTGAPPTLADLGRLVADARAAGVEIAASIDVPAPGAGVPEVPVAVTRAVYRIVQESLTNALKHASGSGVSVQVEAAPGRGVSVAVVSWLPVDRGARDAGVDDASRLASRPSLGAGAGAGIVGMRERATALGGSLAAGRHADLWVVRAWLPWRIDG